MHTVRTFILRLLVDPDEPRALRGSLQPVPEGEAQPFADEGALLTILHQMSRQVAETSGGGPAARKPPPVGPEVQPESGDEPAEFHGGGKPGKSKARFQPIQ